MLSVVIVQSPGGLRHLLHPRDHHVPAPPDVQRHIQTLHAGINFTNTSFPAPIIMVVR